jgi:hypothetical protein
MPFDFSALSRVFSENVWIRRSLVTIFSSVVVLTSAAACTLPGVTPSQPITLGLLKRDPSVKKDGYGKINNVIDLNNKSIPAGLATNSGLKLVQQDGDIFYYLTKQKGLFKTTDAGKSWKRQYVFPVGSTNPNNDQRTKEINDQLAKNNSFLASDFVLDPTNNSVGYLAGKYNRLGKIYQTTDGGESFKEIYSEVKSDVGVLYLAVDPTSSLRVYGMLEGGALIRSMDGGQTWQKLRTFDDTPVQMGFVPEFDNLFFILFAKNGLSISKNNGQTWETVKTTREASKIGEDQPSSGFNLDSQSDFGTYEKIIPVTASQGSWILIADKQMWYTESLQEPFKKLVLPLQAEQYNLLDVAPDPDRGLDKLLVSVNNRLFETNNRGDTWSTGDKVQVRGTIGNIGQILIDKTNKEVSYLMLVDPKATRGSSLFGSF